MSAPRAAELQGGSNGADEPLVLRARQGSPRRRWWWGIRNWYETVTGERPSEYAIEVEPGVFKAYHKGAWCYLCDRPIATWSGTWPVTESAKLAISAHRTAHIQGRLDTPPTPGDET